MKAVVDTDISIVASTDHLYMEAYMSKYVYHSRLNTLIVTVILHLRKLRLELKCFVLIG